MDPIDDPTMESVEDSKWLEKEANALVGKLGEVGASPRGTQLTPSDADVTFSPTPARASAQSIDADAKVKFGANVSVRYLGQDYHFIYGRTDPPELPGEILEMLKTMSVGEHKRLGPDDAITAPLDSAPALESAELDSDEPKKKKKRKKDRKKDDDTSHESDENDDTIPRSESTDSVDAHPESDGAEHKKKKKRKKDKTKRQDASQEPDEAPEPDTRPSMDSLDDGAQLTTENDSAASKKKKKRKSRKIKDGGASDETDDSVEGDAHDADHPKADHDTEEASKKKKRKSKKIKEEDASNETDDSVEIDAHDAEHAKGDDENVDAKKKKKRKSKKLKEEDVTQESDDSVEHEPSDVAGELKAKKESGEHKKKKSKKELKEIKNEVVLLACDKVWHVVNGGTIVKRLIHCPEETINDKHSPTFETVVRLDMIGRVEATKEVFDVRRDWEFRIGEGELGLGMERAVRTMHRGERSEFTFLPPWPVSLCQNPIVPVPDMKNTPVVYEVHLKSFVDAKTPFECKTYEDHLTEAKLRHEQGNRAHEAKHFTLAITKYTKAQLYLEQFNDFKTPEEEETFKQLKVTLWLNLAASNIKIEEYEKAKLHCSNALEIDPKNIKGLYRRASSCIALNDYDTAKTDLTVLLEVEPENVLAKHLMKRVNEKFAKDAVAEKETYQRIFTKLEEPEAEPLYKKDEPANPPAPASSAAVAAPAKSNTTVIIAAASAVVLLLAIVLVFLNSGK